VQLGEYKPVDFFTQIDFFSLNEGQTRERQGNFFVGMSIKSINEVKRMGVWAGFSEQ
jgi:hypothetical protein